MSKEHGPTGTFIVIKSSRVKEERFGPTRVRSLLNNDDVHSMSIALVKIAGDCKLRRNSSGDSAYFVMDGAGDFAIDGQDVSVRGGDFVFIPQGTPYLNSGNMNCLRVEVHTRG